MIQPDWRYGYTTRCHLLLDLDNTCESKAIKLSQLIMLSWPEIGDCLVVRSSMGKPHPGLLTRRGYNVTMHNYGESYHLIFDNMIGYNKCVKIIYALVGFGILNRAYRYVRQFRGDMTLRTSGRNLPYDLEPPPKPRAFVRNNHTVRHDGLILEYLHVLSLSWMLWPGPSQPSHLAETSPMISI
jgi:hypothetical protein